MIVRQRLGRAQTQGWLGIPRDDGCYWYQPDRPEWQTELRPDLEWSEPPRAWVKIDWLGYKERIK